MPAAGRQWWRARTTCPARRRAGCPKWVVDERLRGPGRGDQFRPPTRLAPVRRAAGSRRRCPRSWRSLVVAARRLGRRPGAGASAARRRHDGTARPAGRLAPRQSTPAAGKDFPTPGYEEEATRLLPPATAPKASKAWRPLDVQVDAAGKPTTTPVMWDPCRPIRYVVRPDGAPPGGAELVAEGFRAMEKATGLKFVPDGTIDEAPSRRRGSFQPERYGDRWAPVLVAWQSADENPDFAADVAGQAGPGRRVLRGPPRRVRHRLGRARREEVHARSSRTRRRARSPSSSCCTSWGTSWGWTT